MAKLLKYTFLLQEPMAWTQLSQFEADLVDFFGAVGVQATMIDAMPGSPAERVMELKRIDFITKATNNNQTVREPKPVQRSMTPPPKDFKQFKNPKQPFVQPPKLSYEQGRTNRMKVRS